MCRMRYAFLLLPFIFSIKLEAQIQWPAITQTAKPWTRWWWQGSAVDKENLSWTMQQYQAAGLGGLEITPIYGVKGHESDFIDFLSPKWMDMLQYTLLEAKKLGLGIDMANATGWPFGGPWVQPADACKNINQKTYYLKQGEELKEPIRFTQVPFYRSESKAQVDMKTLSYPIATNKNLQAYAFDQVRFDIQLKPFAVLAYDEHNAMTDLSKQVDDRGILHWTAPAGNWKILALFTGFHGKMVERAAPGGEGDVIDHFNAQALQHYLARFDSAFKGRNIAGIRSFFNDSYEVDDARGQSNWTPSFLQDFEQRRGYDLRKYIPLLLGRDSTETGRRVLSDYRQTISDLLLDNFTKPWQHWATGKQKMIRNQSHGSPANILDLYAVVDIPETEGADILRFKFATSTAHVMGKPLASAETATWLNEHFQSSLGDVKLAVDKYFVGGVNHVFWHGTNYSPKDEPWPGWLFYAAVHFTPANPFWRDFGTLNKYVTRCQSFLQQGKPDNDVLIYFPFNDRIAETGRDLLLHFDGMEGFDKTVFKSSAEWLLKEGYAFDLISDKQVLGIKPGMHVLQTGGVNYKTIVLSDVKYLPLETLQKLKQLAAQGNNIIFYRHLPASVPGLDVFEKKQEELQSLLHSLQFIPVTGSSMQKADIGKGAFLLGDDLAQLLQAAHVNRETLVDEGLQYVRRQNKTGHCYFISNPTQKTVAKWVPLQVAAKAVVIYDPMNERAGIANTRIREGITEVLLQLDPGASCILETKLTPIAGVPFAYDTAAGLPVQMEGNWSIEFVSGGPVLPEMVTDTKPGSWTDLPGEAVKQFSGTAKYSIRFARPAAVAARYKLNLGNVQESASLWLNGKKITTLLGPVYTAVIPASLLKEQNLLEVYVTNGMPNRIAAVEKSGQVWKKFYNTNLQARLPQNRGADGIFTAAAWQPKASGLLGPVTIQALK